MKSIIKKVIKAALVAAFWLTVWEIGSLIAGKEILLPSPARVITEFFRLAAGADFWLSCGASLIRICSGLLCGTLCGVILAVLCIKSNAVNALMSPVLSVIRATPVASFIILALVWLGRSTVPAFTSFLMVLPVVWNSVTTSVRSADVQLLEMAEVFQLSATKKLTKIYIPTVLPSFAGGFRTSLGLAWKAGVAAEVLCTPKNSIGTSLYESKIYLETAQLFAWTASVIILSMLLEHLFDRAIRRLCVKYQPQNGSDENA